MKSVWRLCCIDSGHFRNHINTNPADNTARLSAPRRYVAALSQDLVPGKPKGVDIFGRRVVLFRDAASGAVRCLEDVCPHRGAPLSEGWLEAKNGRTCVVCPYHGAGPHCRRPSIALHKFAAWLLRLWHVSQRVVCWLVRTAMYPNVCIARIAAQRVRTTWFWRHGSEDI